MHFLCRFMGASKILLILGGIDEGFNAITFLCYKLLHLPLTLLLPQAMCAH